MNPTTDGLDPRFMEFVLSQQNLALMMMGKIPHPDTGATEANLDAARMFIDQLEMIEAKMRGNLTLQETRLLGGVLTQLRLGYVEAMKAPASPTPMATEAEPGADAESQKRFSKSY